MKALRQLASEKGLKLEAKMPLDLPDHVFGDGSRLRQVMTNLIGNAIKFTDSGSVSLQVEPEMQTSEECVLLFSVTDTGVGVPAEQQALIFEPFRQADGSATRKHGGTGLGLAICARLVDLMGGRIWMESIPGSGSTFYFTAHFKRQTALESMQRVVAPAPRPVAPTHETSLRILVAEDNKVNQKLALRLLQKMGNKVTIANNGLEALHILAEQAFDLVLLDVQMPELGGLEAVAILREKEAQSGAFRQPIIAMTACAMSGDRERCLEGGMDGYVTKPVSADVLIEEIRQVLPGWRGPVSAPAPAPMPAATEPVNQWVH
ncbi:MAG: response regulator [Acidobacteria bacterium]|nr:response regulator [Acidobacteriota bacterium]